MKRLITTLAAVLMLSPIAALAQEQPYAMTTEIVTAAPDNTATSNNAGSSNDTSVPNYVLLGIGGN